MSQERNRISNGWAHLQVTSCYSLQYGTARPRQIAERAVELGHDLIALTDRDGLYGAVQWVQACEELHLSAVLGVELAVEEVVPDRDRSAMQRRRTPVRGGRWRDEHRPRMLFLAQGRQGWASLCRLVSAAHCGDQTTRGEPWLTLADAGRHCAGVIAVLGAESEAGWRIAQRDSGAANRIVAAWRGIFGDRLHIAATCHRQPGQHPYSLQVGAGLLHCAARSDVPAVISGAVRYLDSADAQVADVLDASRLLVPLSSGRLQRGNGEAYLRSPQQLTAMADSLARAAGVDLWTLQRRTRELAESCVIDATDLGIGEVFVPELDLLLGSNGAASNHDEVERAQALLTQRCQQQIPHRYLHATEQRQARDRLRQELAVIAELGFAGYFLAVAEVVQMTKESGIRVAARGSGAGCLVNHLLEISEVDPIRHDLLMERFLSPLRRVLPDIDIDVESARRLEVYDAILDRFGPQRVACVSMMESYRVRHAIRDTGAAFGLPPGEIDAMAKAFPHIRARDVRSALRELPELRDSGLGRMAAQGELDGFLAIVEALDGLPRHVALHPCGVLLSDASLLDRTPVEMSAAGYPMSQFDKDDVETLGLLKLDVLGVRMQSAIAHALDEIERTDGTRIELDHRDLNDPSTFALISSTRTLGCFQIESPGQRELIGKFGPQTFGDLIIDISLFRPGPVKSDMVTPFLRARQGWAPARYPHPDLQPILAETYGVVVFHEQVIRIVATMTGCDLAQADEIRRSMNTPTGIDDVRAWFTPTALRRGYPLPVVEEVWEVLRAFASFGFCKAHAAAFAMPTYQSAWLKAHHPVAFYAGILTHDPGMYPQRLILDDARNHGVQILGVDVNRSDDAYRVEGGALRLPLGEVRGITDDEVSSLIEHRPYTGLADCWRRAKISRPTAEHLILAGGFDSIYGFTGQRRRGRLTRRDLLLQVADLDRYRDAGNSDQLSLALDIDTQFAQVPSGLPELSDAERVRAELDILGMDVSHHVMEFYAEVFQGLGITRSKDLLRCRSQQEVLVAGVKVATQTPPIRSGKRVIFLTLDDGTGPVDATFFENVQQRYAKTVFHSWLLVVRGHIRRTGPRGVSLRATGCWELGLVHRTLRDEGSVAVRTWLDTDRPDVNGEPVTRRVLVHASGFRQSPFADVRPAGQDVRGPASRLWHASPGSSGW
ncbi:MAG: DNA polymerase III subunit alpha [Actinomycetales bacterium]|nr:DNA polymerase III subunit alpha [Actinomycetales bacterium]